MAPKAEIKQEKKDRVRSLAEIMRKAGSVTFVDYSGMSVKAQQELKNKLREAGGAMFVAKNTLLKLAGVEAKISNEALSGEVLSGQTAVIVSSDDPVSPIQVLGKHIAENEMPSFKAGVVEGIYQDKEGLVKISKLPGKSELYAQVVGAVGAPMYGVVGMLQGNLQKLLFILEQAKNRTPAAS